MGTSSLDKSRRPLRNFPDLNQTNCKITSDESILYNCVAWAAGINNKYYWPDGSEGLNPDFKPVWPKGIPNQEDVESLVAFFETYGYSLCEGPELEEGFLKVAIFVLCGEPTHASRQLPCGKWTSKMGWDGVDIMHVDLHCIEGRLYGKATHYLKKAVSGDAC